MMVYFRSHFSQEDLQKINDEIITSALSNGEDEVDENTEDSGQDPPSHGGKLLVDATCSPAEITYPTDLKLLNEAREKPESYINLVHEPLIGKRKKPRAYLIQARNKYLTISKQKRPGKKIRFAGSGRGKRGGIRVIYYLWHNDTAFMLLACPKNKQSDLTPNQLKILKNTIEGYANER